MTKAPVHLWIVGVLSLLWNAGGAMDYVFTRIGHAEYLAEIPAERLAMLEGAPLWFAIAWAVGVWLSVVGSICLLMRLRFAGSAFALSLLGLIVSMIYLYGIEDGAANLAVAGPMAIVFTVVIPVVLVGLFLYARAMTQRGVLH